MSQRIDGHSSDFQNNKENVKDRLTHESTEGSHVDSTIIKLDSAVIRRRLVLFIVIVCISVMVSIVVLVSVNNSMIAESKIDVTDLIDYGEFEDFSGLSTLKIFPKDVESEQVNFYQYYYHATLLDDSYQIILEYTYKKLDFEEELERLSKLHTKGIGNSNRKIKYDETLFKYPAYITIYNFYEVYEYALIKRDEMKIIYVYIENTNSKSLKFSSDYLPIVFDGSDWSYSFYDASAD